MSACRVFLMLVLSIFLSLTKTFGQLTVFELTQVHRQEIKHIPSENGNHDVTNFILSEIARAIPRNIDMTSFAVDFRSMIQVKQLDSVNYTVFCELKDMRFSGDLLYRDINIAHILIPDLVDFQVSVQHKDNSGNLVFRENYQNIPLQNNMGYFTILQTGFKDVIPHSELTASIDRVSLIWGEDAKKNFQEIISVINDYFQSDIIIRQLHEILTGINLDETEKIAFNNIVLREAEKEFRQLRSRDFHQLLALWISDPVGYTRRMDELEKQMNTYRHTINSKLEQLDRLYFEQGINALRNEKYDTARHFFSKAIEYNPAYVPALTELAYLDYRKGFADSASLRIIHIFERTIISPEHRNRFTEVCRLVISMIEESVSRKILLQDFVEAEELLFHSQKICRLAPELNCSENTEKLMGRVKYGLYKSLIVVVEKAIEHKKFEIAATYINEAVQFQRENSAYIITSSEADQYIEVLFSSFLREIALMNQNRQFLRSLEKIEWLESYCLTNPVLNCSALTPEKSTALTGIYQQRLLKIEEDISKKNYKAAETRLLLLYDFVMIYDEIDFDFRYSKAEQEIWTFYYNSMIIEGINNLEYGFYEPALKKFIEASEIQEKFRLEKFRNFDSIGRKAAIPVLISNYNKSIQQSQNQSVLSLQKMSDEYRSVKERFGIVAVDSILRLQKQLNDIIFQRTCDSLSNHLNRLYFQADSLVNRQKFSVADSLLQEAESMCNVNPGCELSTSGIMDFRRKIRAGTEWEQEQKILEQMISEGQWEQAIQQFLVVDRISSSHLLFMWGVDRTALTEFIVSHKNIEFQLSGFEYFFETKQYDEAFLMLEHLRKMQYPVIKTEDLQKRLGLKLAVRDKIANSAANYKINILKYTEGEEYFLYFSKSYRRTWRRN